MGAKTAMLVYADGGVAEALGSAAGYADEESAAELLTLLHPSHQIRPDGEEPWELADAVFPPEGRACALSAPTVDVLCDQALMIDRPSQLPEHLVAASAGRRLVLHAMHSVVDWFAFAVWEDGVLVRSLSLAPDDGVLEDLGDRLPFEEPYWAGEHPASPWSPDSPPYPLPFHPLALGERALLELFGFSLEGEGEEHAVDPWEVQLFGFEVA
ncbi:DUF6928 family protein [Antribacter gilvus]|uniref:DUF6928 family protein n=1 Tax=Antribacter gilvus TaxID=2304675 RepID=UPI001980BC3D|nr:hypothetical protein [Antribacter gilvus]